MQIRDSGFAKLELTAADGTSVAQDLDVWEALGAIADFEDKALAENSGRNGWLYGFRDWLHERGWPKVSLHAVKQVADAVLAAVDGLKKKDGAGVTPNSPDSTGQAPSPSAPATS